MATNKEVLLDRRMAFFFNHVRDVGLAGLINSSSCTEICINSNGQVWVEKSGGGWECLHEVSEEKRGQLVSTIASLNEKEINEHAPLLEAAWPRTHHRVHASVPPISSGTCVTIRKHERRNLTLAQYVADEIMTAEQATLLSEEIYKRSSIIVSGGTRAGKTTLVNALLQESVARGYHGERYVLLEETPELQCAADNKEHLFVTTQTPLRALVRAALRMRPDRLIVGEVRGGEALDMLKAWNTGHRGGMTTIHANSAEAVEQRLALLVAETGTGWHPSLFTEAIDLIVHMSIHDEGRRVDIQRVKKGKII